MSRHVLVVYPNSDMLVEIMDLLEKLRDTKGYNLSWSTARNLDVALSKAREGQRPDLVITAVEIWADGKAADGAGEQHRRGLDLVREVRKVNPRAAAILVTGQVDNEIFALIQSENSGLAFSGAGILEKLRSEMVRFLGPNRPAVPRRVNLEIYLTTEGQSGYQFQVDGQPPQLGQPLEVDKEKLRTLVRQSLRIHDEEEDAEEWEIKLKEVGRCLADVLFDGAPTNRKFRDEFNEWKGAVGIQNIRVRFTVQNSLHPVIVEAVMQEENGEFWMLQTAVYRGQTQQHYRSAEPHGLFQDEETAEGPLNFLIVQADLPYLDIVSEGEIDVRLDHLPNVADEVEKVVELLADLREHHQPIGEVRVLAATDMPAGTSVKDLVEDLLRNGDTHWHILHYAGHTYYDATNDAGYLFFPDANGKYEPVKIDVFALWLTSADTRFVFLSSCESAQQDFISHLAKVRVPAIMGYRWKVEDSKAMEFAKSFYDKLLGGNEHSLEYACLAAKKDMHANYAHNRIWASPVLVMQVGV